MKKLFLAVLIMAVAAVPAFASVQNVKISGSVNTTGLHRQNFDLGASTANYGDEKQNILYTVTNLRVDADLIENVSATIALINEREWTSDVSAADTDIDLHLAYVTLREMLYSPLTVVIGRQAFAYGNSFVVSSNAMGGGDSNLSEVNDLNTQYSADAIRLIFDYNPLTLEVLWAKIDENTATAAASDEDDVDLYGINATYELGDDMNTVIEGYFFSKITKYTDAGDANDIDVKNDTIYVPGIRMSTNPIEGLNIQAEYAHQAGTKADSSDASNQQERSANAAQFMANYMIPVMEEYNPIASYSYTWVSGDRNIYAIDVDDTSTVKQASEERYVAWDPMYEDQGVGTIANALFVLSGCHVHSMSLQANPMEDVTLKGTATWAYLDKKVDHTSDLFITQPDGGYVPASPSSSSGIASMGGRNLFLEYDLEGTYAYTEDVEIGAALGILFPGEAISHSYREPAKQALVNVNVAF